MKEYIFKSLNDGKTKIRINKDSIEIERPGIMSKFSHGLSGTKTILIKNISAVQIKKAGLTRGYIQFILAGSRENRSGAIFGSKDENIIYYELGLKDKSANENAMEIKDYIEKYNSSDSSKDTSAYDDLLKLNELLKNNIITKQEFEIEKKKILHK